jgi:hypothetical protein
LNEVFEYLITDSFLGALDSSTILVARLKKYHGGKPVNFSKLIDWGF